jgi:hypothetical protein
MALITMVTLVALQSLCLPLVSSFFRRNLYSILLFQTLNIIPDNEPLLGICSCLLDDFLGYVPRSN